MANSLKQVKTRIVATKGTQQITRAMYMVSQAKIRKADTTYKNYKDFMSRIGDLVNSVLSKADSDEKHPMMVSREVKKTAYIVVTSDRGLAGAYNSNLSKELERLISTNHKDKSEYVVGAIGKKGSAFIRKKHYPILTDKATHIRDDVMFMDIVPLADAFISEYNEGRIDKLVIIFNHYVNTLVQEVTTKTILPISEIEGKVNEVDYDFETGIDETINTILPMYISNSLYGIILDAKVSEHASRMNSMRNATDNADNIIDELQLMYNRARQEVITNELTDIIGGANAIGGK